jgi:hypothetical protein
MNTPNFDDQAAELKRQADLINYLEAENKKLREALATAQTVIREAKDPSPVEKPSRQRVAKLVSNCCMTLEKIPKGWRLKMGSAVRFFRRLSEIWKLLNREDWHLSEIFPPGSEILPPSFEPSPKSSARPNIRQRRNPFFQPQTPPWWQQRAANSPLVGAS